MGSAQGVFNVIRDAICILIITFMTTIHMQSYLFFFNLEFPIILTSMSADNILIKNKKNITSGLEVQITCNFIVIEQIVIIKIESDISYHIQ